MIECALNNEVIVYGTHRRLSLPLRQKGLLGADAGIVGAALLDLLE